MIMLRLLLAAPLLLVGVVSCSSGGPEEAAMYGVATYEPSGEGGDTALFEGELFREGDCVYIRDDVETALPIFPADEVSATDTTLTYRGNTYTYPARIGLGGGGLPPDVPIDEATIPSGCATDVGRFIVAQS